MTVKTMTGSYPFNAAAKTLDLSSIPGFDFRQLRYIGNLTHVGDMYAISDPDFPATESGGIVTFASVPAGSTNNDLLEITYDDQSARAVPTVSGGAAIFDGSTVTANQSSSTSNGGLTYIGAPTGTNPASANVKSGAAFAPNTVLRGCFRLNINLNGGSFSGGQFWAGFSDATADLAHLIEGKFIGVAFNTAYGGNIAACGLTAKISNGGYAIQNAVPTDGQIVVVWINPSTGAYAIMTPNGTVHAALGANTGGFWSSGLLTVQAGCSQTVSGAPLWSMTGLVGLPAGISDPDGFEGAIDVFSTAGTPAYTQSLLAKDASVQALGPKLDTLHADLVGIAATDASLLTAVTSLSTAVTATTTAVTGVHTAITALDADVQAGNTSLGTINVHVAAIDTATSGLAAALSTLESAAATTNIDLGQLHTDNTGINSLITSGNGLLTTISGTLSTIHGDIGTSNTDLAQLHTDLGTVITDLAQLHSDLGTANGYLSTVASNTTSQLTSLGSIDTGIGGPTAAAAGNTGASTTNGFLRWMRDFWYARLGALVAALSLSVTIASDDAQFGVAATGIVPNTGGTGLAGWLSSILYNVRGAYAALSGTLAMNLSQIGAAAFALGSRTVANSISVLFASDYGVAQTSGTLDNTTTTTLSLVPPAGAGTVTFSLGSYSGAIVFQVTTPSGTFSLAASNRGNATLPAGNPSASQAGNFDAAIPAGATAVIINAAGLTSGTVAAWISTRPGPPNSTPANVLAAGTARAFMNVSASKWIQQSTANLAAGATVTGSWVDCLNATSGNIGGAASYPGRYNPFGTMDKTCTLYVDQSPDASTSYQSDTFVGAIPTDGSNYVAKPPVGTAILPGIRYCRARLKNTSGSTSGTLYLSDVQVAA